MPTSIEVAHAGHYVRNLGKPDVAVVDRRAPINTKSGRAPVVHLRDRNPVVHQRRCPRVVEVGIGPLRATVDKHHGGKWTGPLGSRHHHVGGFTSGAIESKTLVRSSTRRGAWGPEDDIAAYLHDLWWCLPRLCSKPHLSVGAYRCSRYVALRIVDEVIAAVVEIETKQPRAAVVPVREEQRLAVRIPVDDVDLARQIARIVESGIGQRRPDRGSVAAVALMDESDPLVSGESATTRLRAHSDPHRPVRREPGRTWLRTPAARSGACRQHRCAADTPGLRQSTAPLVTSPTHGQGRRDASTGAPDVRHHLPPLGTGGRHPHL